MELNNNNKKQKYCLCFISLSLGLKQNLSLKKKSESVGKKKLLNNFKTGYIAVTMVTSVTSGKSKMSDSNAENINSENEPKGTESSGESKPGLVKLTNKLKAEALRRLKLDEEQELQVGDSDSDAPVADSVTIRPEAEVLKPQPLEVEQGETKQRNSHENDDTASIQEDVTGTERGTNIENSDRLNEEIATLDNSGNQAGRSSQPLAEESATSSGKENLFVDPKIGEYAAPDVTDENETQKISISNNNMPSNSGDAKPDDVRLVSESIIDDKPGQGIADDLRETLNESETSINLGSKHESSSSGNLNSFEDGQGGYKVPLNNTDNSLSASTDFDENIPLHVKDQLGSEDGELSGKVKPVIPVLLNDEVSKSDNGQMSPVLGEPKATSVTSEENKTIQDSTGEKPENIASIAATDPNMDSPTGSKILNTSELEKHNKERILKYFILSFLKKEIKYVYTCIILYTIIICVIHSRGGSSMYRAPGAFVVTSCLPLEKAILFNGLSIIGFTIF